MARRARGTSAGLDRVSIALAAVGLIDRDGLDRFGVRRLADELGVDPMSIYHHVKGKAALLDAACEVVLAEMRITDGEPEGWQSIARRTAHAYRDMAHRHPQVFPLLAGRAQTSASALAALERLVAAMRDAGVPEQVAADAPSVLFGFLNGHLLARTAAEAHGAAAVPDFDADAYPTLTELAPRLADFGSEAEFDRMLGTILAGIASGR
ncbi:TetR/AcrR family transcriptional regulator C-terminal domain-containing protein [Streptomyces atriruber]|uniref:TetR/AcrR family transcriptional regulator C-terminal domain-containing protein n=1 Tax=Streptomyces atriruber TaxID=545121 RepID=UPI0006E3C382|nr:TetR/AcrR family transcriptional regulator C-terminal domain-containing protein [Streptomyces atriruber]